jgi:hypothetical protein
MFIAQFAINSPAPEERNICLSAKPCVSLLWSFNGTSKFFGLLVL